MKSAMQTEEVCTTQRAAELLGISVSTVQQLVEAGQIEAWKTKGGHRRIPLAAVMAYKAQPALDGLTPAPRPVAAPGAGTSILIVEDNPMQRQLYEKHIGGWTLPASLSFCENGYQALLEIARRQPDILLVDVMMEGIDGYELINTILADRQLRPMHIAILSGLEQTALQARGGVPRGVVFFHKPVNYDELRGYLRACCAQQERDRN
ncbi:excisionase family DNA-binding protein [Duganella sp. FT94W]|uniref:Excisionase family DNA-binding protein n=1 Tax=Duganella lactea TaxID=2692173 RepID=A0ABW9V436_9BURK|nr:excisionase family DNA-binding protein [Duganella lactea]MYM33480.1 excisionase family DNA-binding protein [Duganella lactea]